MEYLLIVIASFYLGYKVCEAIMTLSFREILKDLQIPDERIKNLAQDKGVQTTESESIELWVEEIQGHYYAYESQKNHFVTQAKNPEDLLTQIIDYYPAGTKIVLDKDRGGRLIQDAAKKLKMA